MPSNGKRQPSSREQVLELYGLYVQSLRHEACLYRHLLWVFIATQTAIGVIALQTLGFDSWLIWLLSPEGMEQRIGLLGFALISLVGAVHALSAYSQLLTSQNSIDHLGEAWNTKYWTLAHSFGLPDLAVKPCTKASAVSHPVRMRTPRLPFFVLLGWTCLAAISLVQLAFEVMT